MKSKLLFLILLLLQITAYSQTTVPDNDTYSQSTVEAVLGLGPTSLSNCFANSNASYFDPDYGSKTMNPQKLSGFRNYGWLCEMPEGLNTYMLYSRISINGTQTDFSGSLATAKQAAYDYNDKRGRTVEFIASPYTSNNYVVSAASISAGQHAYHTYSTADCPTILAGYYLYASGGTVIDKIVYVQERGTIYSVTNALSIGDNIGGGILAYILTSSDVGYSSTEINGYIISSSNVSSCAVWGCTGLPVTTSTNLGQGATNTSAILSACSDPTIAAKLCDTYSSGAYTDFHLPSRDELAKCIMGLTSSYFTANVHYWSSSQWTNTNGVSLYRSGTAALFTNDAKSSSLAVSAIRYF